MESNSLSIIIPTKNRKEDLIDCVHSILRQDRLPDELFLIDQSDIKGDTEATIKSLINNKFKIAYIYDPKILGSAQARNIALKMCQGNLVLFLDDDVVLLEHALSNMLDIFIKDSKKEIGGVGLAIVNQYQYSSLKDVIVSFIFCHGPFRSFFLSTYFYYKREYIKEKLFYSRIISGCSCYRKEVFSYCEFDENYMGYSAGEDVLLSYAVSERFKTFLTPLSKILHDRSNKYRKEKGDVQKYLAFLYFCLFNRFVDKTVYNVFCYLMLIMQDFCKALFNFYNLSVLRGIYLGYKSIFRIIFKQVTIEEGISELLR